MEEVEEAGYPLQVEVEGSWWEGVLIEEKVWRFLQPEEGAEEGWGLEEVGGDLQTLVGQEVEVGWIQSPE